MVVNFLANKVLGAQAVRQDEAADRVAEGRGEEGGWMGSGRVLALSVAMVVAGVLCRLFVTSVAGLRTPTGTADS